MLSGRRAPHAAVRVEFARSPTVLSVAKSRAAIALLERPSATKLENLSLALGQIGKRVVASATIDKP